MATARCRAAGARPCLSRVSRVSFACAHPRLQWYSHDGSSAYLPDHRLDQNGNVFLQSITIASPIATFTSAPGADLNAFLMMAGASALFPLFALLCCLHPTPRPSHQLLFSPLALISSRFIIPPPVHLSFKTPLSNS